MAPPALTIRPATRADLGAVLGLYRAVAATPGGLARLEHEVDEAYVAGFLEKALRSGVGLVAVDAEARIVGEIHAGGPGLFCFAHVLTDLTIAVDPGSQGAGLGRMLFERFMTEVREKRPDISRVELIARESNTKAIRFYESLGFKVEGRFEGRIANLDGTREADIPMGWVRAGNP